MGTSPGGRHRRARTADADARAFRVRRIRAGPTCAFTIVELMTAVAVLVIAMLSASRAIVASIQLSSSNQLLAIANEAARREVEILRGETLSGVFARYDGLAADDPGGAGTAPGASFAVPGLAPVAGDADGMVGEIVFNTAAAAPGVLREDLANSAIGMPRDLNLDGAIDAANHAADYRILPVLVRLTWRGTRSRQVLSVRTILGGP